MKIIAADDEKMALETLVEAIKKAEPEAEVAGFSSGREVLAYVKNNVCQVAFLDIRMGGMDGITLAKRMKSIDPKINIIFSTGYSEYTGDAMSLRASGYVMKPVTPEKVREELDNLRFPVEKTGGKRLCIQTFGNFEVFADGKPIVFKYSKAKELLAYLVDRHGAMCTNGEAISVLWENDDDLDGKAVYFKSVRRDMISVLKGCGCGDVIIQHRGSLAIDTEKVQCDYYDWLDGKAEGINAYRGEYMYQYSWGELRHIDIE